MASANIAIALAIASVHGLRCHGTFRCGVQNQLQRFDSYSAIDIIAAHASRFFRVAVDADRRARVRESLMLSIREGRAIDSVVSCHN